MPGGKRLENADPARPPDPPDLSESRLERRLSAWVETGHDWLWETTMEGTFTYSAASGSAYCGYTPEEAVQLRLHDVVHEVEHARLDRLLQAGRGWHDEVFRCVSKDGTERWLTGSAIADVDTDGVVRGYIGTAQQLTADVELIRHRHADEQQVRDLLAGDDLTIVFQPIVNTETGMMVGAEALSRFPPPAPTPDIVFARAAAVGLGADLELLAVRNALRAASALPVDLYISVNVSPSTLLDSRLLEHLDVSGFPLSKLVLEITEHVSIEDYDVLARPAQALRDRGVRMAVDDAGAGFASFRHILSLSPQLIKLDRTLIDGIDSDPARRAFAGAVVMFALEMGSTVIAEGVETIAELRCAQLLGIDSAQGYLLGRPTQDWTTWSAWHERGPLYRLSTPYAAV